MMPGLSSRGPCPIRASSRDDITAIVIYSSELVETLETPCDVAN